jgi:hypothetical protein
VPVVPFEDLVAMKITTGGEKNWKDSSRLIAYGAD